MNLTLTAVNPAEAAGVVSSPPQTIAVHVTAPAGVSGQAQNLGLDDLPGQHGPVALTLTGIPDGWNVGGATRNADGSWTTTTDHPEDLSVTPPTDFVGARMVTAMETVTNADGSSGTALVGDNIEAFAPGTPIFALNMPDHLTGGAEADTFVFSNSAGLDTIYKFDVAEDTVDLVGYAGLASFADLASHLSEDANGNAVITLGADQSITLDGVHASDLTAANFEFDHVATVNNAGTIDIGNGAMLPLGGAIANSGTIELNSAGSQAELQLEGGATLTGHGSVVMSDDSNNLIDGSGVHGTLTNVDNTISGAGEIGGGDLALVNGGTIDATGTNALVIDTGANVVSNSGTLEASGSGGLVVHGDVDNSGLLWANNSGLTIEGHVGGTGSALISGTGSLEFGAGAHADVAFDAGSAGTLKLDDSIDFSGVISGLNNASKIDFADIAFGAHTEASFTENAQGTGGALTVSDGTHVATVEILGQGAAGGLEVTADGLGGTIVKHHDDHSM